KAQSVVKVKSLRLLQRFLEIPGQRGEGRGWRWLGDWRRGRPVDARGPSRIPGSAVFRLDEAMAPPPDLDPLSPTGPERMALKLFEEGAELRRMVAASRDE